MPPLAKHASIDPLELAIQPPEDESPEARALRLAHEAEAKRISHSIDEQLRAERLAQKKKRIVRILLLGQSESGKSTTLKQFQRLYTPTAFREDRMHWRSVVQLNVIRSVYTILTALTSPTPPATVSRSYAYSTSSRPRSIDIHPSSDDHSAALPIHALNKDFNLEAHDPLASVDIEIAGDEPTTDSELECAVVRQNGHSNGNSNGHAHSRNSSQAPISFELEDGLGVDQLITRLLPLRHAEALLKAKLVPPGDDVPADAYNDGIPVSSALTLINKAHYSEKNGANGHSTPREFFVRPGRWRGLLRTSESDKAELDNDECQRTLYKCREDMLRLWNSPRVRSALAARKVRLEEEGGFFLNDLDRLTKADYTPSDDDVLRARLRTMGVSEHKFEMESGDQRGSEWRIIDVGGSRFQRHTWVPFFDNVDAIIFLVPISAFDQVLSEDERVNRLEDSVLLWKAVCSNKLLAHIDLVLFLNKCDILQRKLESGIQLSNYVKSYGERPNDVDTACKYFRSKFSAIQRTCSPLPRKFYGFCTSVTDTTTTSGILASVRDIVIRQNLRKVKLT